MMTETKQQHEDTKGTQVRGSNPTLGLTTAYTGEHGWMGFQLVQALGVLGAFVVTKTRDHHEDTKDTKVGGSNPTLGLTTAYTDEHGWMGLQLVQALGVLGAFVVTPTRVHHEDTKDTKVGGSGALLSQ